MEWLYQKCLKLLAYNKKSCILAYIIPPLIAYISVCQYNKCQYNKFLYEYPTFLLQSHDFS